MRHFLFKIAPACLALLLFTSMPARAQDSTLIAFDMQDQFKQKHSDDAFRGHVVILIGSDRGGSDFNPRWGKAIADSLKGHPRYDDVRFLSVADVRGVPFFMKGFVRGKMPKQKDRWVLTDWDGEFAKAYNWQSDHSNIIIFDRQGKLRYQTAVRELDSEQLGEIVRQVQRVLEEAGTGN